MLLGIAAYAAHRGCDTTAVQYAIAAGRIALTGDNQIDSDEADRQWLENTDAAQARPGPKLIARGGSPGEPAPTEAVPGMTYTQARALREVYDAQRRSLELQLRRGEVVTRADVEKEASRLYRQLRDAILNVPARLSGQLVGQTDEATIYELLEGELRRTLETFAAQEGKAA
jgi:hypothetical protein